MIVMYYMISNIILRKYVIVCNVEMMKKKDFILKVMHHQSPFLRDSFLQGHSDGKSKEVHSHTEAVESVERLRETFGEEGSDTS